MLLCGPNDNWRLLFWTTQSLGGGGRGDFSWLMGIRGQNLKNGFKEWLTLFDMGFSELSVMGVGEHEGPIITLLLLLG